MEIHFQQASIGEKIYAACMSTCHANQKMEKQKHADWSNSKFLSSPQKHGVVPFLYLSASLSLSQPAAKQFSNGFEIFANFGLLNSV